MMATLAYHLERKKERNLDSNLLITILFTTSIAIRLDKLICVIEQNDRIVIIINSIYLIL